MAERIIDLLEVIDIDEMQRDHAAGRRQHRECGVQPFDQPRSIGKSSQYVMVGEELDAPVGPLLFARAPVPGKCRHAKGKRRQAAKRDRCQQESSVVAVVLGGLVHIGRDSGDWPAATRTGT